MDRIAGRPRVSGVARLVLLALILLGLSPRAALALEPIEVSPQATMLDLRTDKAEFYEVDGARIQVETAPGLNGIADRMEVSASGKTVAGWLVFAIKNISGQRLERLLVADRYSFLGSGFIWPDLDKRRIAAVTPSEGFRPERIDSERADIFMLTLDPGDTVTFVVELSAARLPGIHLWEASVYEKSLKNTTLFRGILLGISGLLAIFLTSIFAANHKAIFPAAAFVAWSALAYLSVEYGFLGKLLNLGSEPIAFYRAVSEIAIAASLLIFLFAFLRLRRWHMILKGSVEAWILIELTLIGAAIFDASVAAGLARMSFAAIAAVGTLIIAYLAIRGQDRAISLIPTWLLLLVWIVGAGFAIDGRLSGDIVTSALLSCLILIVTLIGFTVTQYAFRGTIIINGMPRNELELRAQALESTGAAVWEWLTKRDVIRASEELEVMLGSPEIMLHAPREEWMQNVHPSDRDRLRSALNGIVRNEGGVIHQDFRMRRADGAYAWLQLNGRSIQDEPYVPMRCIGTLTDITGPKRAEERLLHDAVHDSLTGLPNRELFLDRLSGAITRAIAGEGNQPTIFFIDVDRFKNINNTLGLTVGDSMLLTISRRLSRHLKPQDTIARIGGDQFAVLLVSEGNPRNIAVLAEQIRRSMRSPMKITGRDIILTGSIGIAIYDGAQEDHRDLLKEAEIAMLRAKSIGPDKIQGFTPDMRGKPNDSVTLETDLRRALARGQIRIFYQPIVNLQERELAGFEALMRWEHPDRGLLHPNDFIPIAEETGLIVDLGMYVLDEATRRLSAWQRRYEGKRPLFVSVNVSSRQLLRHDLVNEIKVVLGRAHIAKGTLKLEVTESLVMENPEYAGQVLDLVKALGAGLALDDFGTGYSSLSYLQRFPFDTVKVDKSFVHQEGANGSTPIILRSIITLAHELQMEVVAEGIEMGSDADHLRRLGCEYGQGFYFGEPMAVTDVDAFIVDVKRGGLSVGSEDDEILALAPPAAGE